MVEASTALPLDFSGILASMYAIPHLSRPKINVI